MQFSDSKKAGKVEFSHIYNKGIGSTPMFTMTLEKPYQVESKFDIHDIRTRNPKTKEPITAIYFSEYTDIAKAFAKKMSVLMSVPPEVMDFIQKTSEEEINKLKEEAKKDPETWIWSEGCDTERLYLSPNTDLLCEFRDDLRKISDTIEKECYFPPKEFSRENKTERGNYIIPHSVVMDLYNKIMEKKEKEAAEAKAKKEALEGPIFAKAKETGKKQLLKTFSVECSDPREECDCDIVSIYAMPDGTTSQTQNHTW